MDTGARAFAEMGHDRVNLVRDILAPAHVGPGSFYLQFADKTDLLIAIIAEAADRRMTRILDVDATNTDELITRLYRRFFDSLDRDDHWWQIQSRERASSEPRIHSRILQGRSNWTRRIADRLRDVSTATPGATELAAEMTVTTAVGLIAIYLDLPEDDRTRRRGQLLRAATAYTSAASQPSSTVATASSGPAHDARDQGGDHSPSRLSETARTRVAFTPCASIAQQRGRLRQRRRRPRVVHRSAHHTNRSSR